MANPNIISATNHLRDMSHLAVTTTPQAILSNAANSGRLKNVVKLLVSNVDGTNNADVTVDIHDGTSVLSRIAFNVTVPAKATLEVIDGSMAIKEGCSLRISASANSDLEATLSFEEIW